MIITIHFESIPTPIEVDELLKITKNITFEQNKAKINVNSRQVALACWNFYLEHHCKDFTWVNK